MQILRCTGERGGGEGGRWGMAWQILRAVFRGPVDGLGGGGGIGCGESGGAPTLLAANTSHFLPHLQHRILLGLKGLQLLDVRGVAPVLTPQLDNLGGDAVAQE